MITETQLSPEDQALMNDILNVADDTPIIDVVAAPSNVDIDTAITRPNLDEEDEHPDMARPGDEKLTKTEKNRARRERYTAERKRREEQMQRDLQATRLENQQLAARLSKFEQTQQQYLTESQEKAVKDQLDQKRGQVSALESELKNAYAAFDTNKQFEIQRQLTRVNAEIMAHEIAATMQAPRPGTSQSPSQPQYSPEQIAQQQQRQAFQQETVNKLDAFTSQPEHYWLRDEFNGAVDGKTYAGNKAKQIFTELSQSMDARTPEFYRRLDERLRIELADKYTAPGRNSPPTSGGNNMAQPSTNNPQSIVNNLVASLSKEHKIEIRDSIKSMKNQGYLKNPEDIVKFIKNYKKGVRA